MTCFDVSYFTLHWRSDIISQNYSSEATICKLLVRSPSTELMGCSLVNESFAQISIIHICLLLDHVTLCLHYSASRPAKKLLKLNTNIPSKQNMAPYIEILPVTFITNFSCLGGYTFQSLTQLTKLDERCLIIPSVLSEVILHFCPVR